MRPWNQPDQPGFAPATNGAVVASIFFHYCLNEEHDGTDANDPARIKLSQIRNPTAVVWVFDSKNIPGIGPALFVHTNLHSSGALFTCLDGRAARFKSREYGDYATNNGRTNDPSIVWRPGPDGSEQMAQFLALGFQVSRVVRIGLHANWHLLDNFQAVAFQTHHLFWIVRHQADGF
jgi:hypothetical protein